MEEENKNSPLLTYWYTGIAFFSLAVISSSGASAAPDIESLNAPLSYWYIPILVFLIFAGASWKSFWGKPSFIKNWMQILLMSFLSIFFCRGGIYYWANCHFDSSGNSAILTLSERTHSSGSDSANYYLIFDQTDIFYDKAKVQVSEELFSTGKAGKEYEIQYGNGLIGLKWIHSVREIPDDRPSLIKDPPIVQEIEPQYAPVHYTGVFKMNLFSNEKRENRYEYTYNGLLTNASSTALKKYSIEVEAVSEDGGFFIKESVPLIQENSVPLQPSDTINVEFKISNLTKENVSGSLKHIRITQKEILTISPAKRKSGKKIDYIWFVSDEEKAAYPFEIVERHEELQEVENAKAKPGKGKPKTYYVLFEIKNTGKKALETWSAFIELKESGGDIFETHKLIPVGRRTPPLKPGESRLFQLKKTIVRSSVEYTLRVSNVN